MKAKIFNHTVWVEEIDPEKLAKRFERLLKGSGFQILNFMDHQFHPKGYTAVWLLAESHLAIHSFPEAGKSYVELSSCSEQKLERFKKSL